MFSTPPPPIHTVVDWLRILSPPVCVCFFFPRWNNNKVYIRNSIRRQSDGKLIERAVLSYLYEGLDMSHSNLVEAIAHRDEVY